MATGGDILLAIREDFYMATDNQSGSLPHPTVANNPATVEEPVAGRSLPHA